MARHRVGEHVGPIAHRRDDQPVRLCQLHPQRRRHRPTQAARVRFLIPTVERPQCQRIHRRAQFRQHRRIQPLNCIGQAQADPGLRHPRPLPALFRRSANARSDIGDLRRHPGAPVRATVRPQWRHRLDQTGDDVGGLPGQRQIGVEIPHRKPAVQRVRPRLNHHAPGLRRVDRRGPRRQTIQHQDDVGLTQPRLWIGAGRHRMVGRDRQLHRPILHDRDTPGISQNRQRREPLGGTGATLGDDHRIARVRQQFGRLPQCRPGWGKAGRRHPRRRIQCVGGAGAAKHLSRQTEVNRAFRRRAGDGMCPVHHLQRLFGKAQFVVPLCRLSDHRRLVTHFLAPADRDGAGTQPPMLQRWGAAGKQQHRHMFGRGVDRADGAVRQADIGVRHDRLSAAGRQIVAMRHAHRRMLVRNDDGFRQRDILGVRFRQAFDDGGKISAGVGEDVVHADGFQSRQDGAAGGDGCWCLRHWGLRPCRGHCRVALPRSTWTIALWALCR